MKALQHQDTSVSGGPATGTFLAAPDDAGGSLLNGGVASTVAALVGAVCWVIVAAVAGRQMSWVAVVIGLLTGYAMRLAGRGDAAIYGVAAGSVALLGCLLGNLLTVALTLANGSSMSYLESLSTLSLSKFAAVASALFHNTDVLFYSISLYLAFTVAYGERNLVPARARL